MGEVQPLPTLGGVFFDDRREARALRVSWHAREGLVVLSIWDGPRCTGTIRLPAGDVPELIHSLTLGLRADGPVGVPPLDGSPEPPGPDGPSGADGPAQSGGPVDGAGASGPKLVPED